MDILEYRKFEMEKTLRATGVANAFLEMAVDRRLAYDYNPTTAIEPPVQVRHPGPGSMPRGITWGANDAMLQKYSFPELMQAGFITCNNLDEIKMDEPFQPFEEEDHQDILLYCDSPDVDEREIHPIFQYDRWKGLHVDDYNLIRPALKLASCIIEEPSIMTLFNGLVGQPWKDILMTDTLKAKFPGQQLKYFEPSDTSDPDVAQCGLDYMYKVLIAAANFITGSFGPLHGLYGITANKLYEPGMRGDRTNPAHVTVNEGYLQTITGLLQASNITPYIADKFAHIDKPAIMRAQFSMANTMVHELCHAIAIMVIPGRSLVNGYVPEPNFRDMRKNELGFAFQTMAFGGPVVGVGQTNNDDETNWEFAFGSSLNEWPELGIVGALGSAFKYDQKVWQRWMVPMRHIQQFFTQRFWEVDVERYQLWAWHMKEEDKMYNVQHQGPLAFLVGESPKTRRWLPPPETREQAVKRLDEWREVLRKQEEDEKKGVEPQFPWLADVLAQQEGRYIMDWSYLADPMDTS